MLLYAFLAVVALWVVVNIPLWVLLYLAAEAAVKERFGAGLEFAREASFAEAGPARPQ